MSNQSILHDCIIALWVRPAGWGKCRHERGQLEVRLSWGEMRWTSVARRLQRTQTLQRTHRHSCQRGLKAAFVRRIQQGTKGHAPSRDRETSCRRSGPRGPAPPAEAPECIISRSHGCSGATTLAASVLLGPRYRQAEGLWARVETQDIFRPRNFNSSPAWERCC